MRTPSEIALEIPTVRRARFRGTTGVVYDGSVDIEFDVRHEHRRWIVSDDDGRYYRRVSLRRALEVAIKRNS